MKRILVVLVAFVAAVVGTVAEAQEQEHVVVVFERSVRDRTVLELVVQEALREADYTPILATGVRSLRGERDWKRLPEGTQKVLIVSDARVLARQRRDLGAGLSLAVKALSGSRVRANARDSETIVTMDVKMVNATDRSIISFGQGTGSSWTLENLGFSTGLRVVKQAGSSGLYRQQARADLVYEAGKKAATAAIRDLQ